MIIVSAELAACDMWNRITDGDSELDLYYCAFAFCGLFDSYLMWPSCTCARDCRNIVGENSERTKMKCDFLLSIRITNGRNGLVISLCACAHANHGIFINLIVILCSRPDHHRRAQHFFFLPYISYTSNASQALTWIRMLYVPQPHSFNANGRHLSRQISSTFLRALRRPINIYLANMRCNDERRVCE